MKQNRLFKLFFSVTGIIIISKLLGLARQVVTASVFGATIDTDLISISQGFIANSEYLLAQTMVTAFVPIYIHAKAESVDRGKKLASDTAKVCALIAGGLLILLEIFAYWISKILAPTYPAELTAQLERYIRLFSLVLVPYVLMAICRALLNANEQFIPGELIGINQSVISILIIAVLSKALGVQTLVISFFVYNIWNLLFLGIKSKPYWTITRGNPFQNRDVRRAFRMMGPLLFGYSMVYVNQQVDKILVSGLPSGTVTAMNYGAVLSNLAATFIGAFCSILFTYITNQIAAGKHDAAAALTMRAMSIMTILFIPISVITVLCANDIVTIAFGHGAFHEKAIDDAASALKGYGYSFVPLVFRELFSRLQYGYQDSKRPMTNSTIGIVFNIGLSVALYKPLGVFGVTIASSISVLVCSILNVVSAKRHNHYIRFSCILRQVPMWGLGGGVCMLLCRFGVSNFMGFAPLSRFVSVTLLSCAGYFLIMGPFIYQLLKKPDKSF